MHPKPVISLQSKSEHPSVHHSPHSRIRRLVSFASLVLHLPRDDVYCFALPLDVCGRAGLYLALRLGYKHRTSKHRSVKTSGDWDVRGALQK